MNELAPNPYSGYEVMYLEFTLDYLLTVEDYGEAVKQFADIYGCSVEDMEEVLKVGQTMINRHTNL